MLNHACQAGSHSLADRGNDLYETAPVAVHALLEAEKLPPTIWEPACGPGSIVNILRKSGHSVYATDLIDYGCPDSEGGIDFLKAASPSFFIGAIVTNPPFKLAAEFATHALTLCPKVILLLRLAFLESEKRRAILENGSLARVHIFRNRLPLMHRAGWQGQKSTNAIPFAWFVWDRAHKGPTEMHRISWVGP